METRLWLCHKLFRLSSRYVKTYSKSWASRQFFFTKILLNFREAFQRVITTILNANINQNVFNRLMDRLGFRDKQVINYSEFFAYFHEGVNSNDYPRWMDPVQRMWPDKATMSSSQVHAQLKEKVKQKYVLFSVHVLLKCLCFISWVLCFGWSISPVLTIKVFL